MTKFRKAIFVFFIPIALTGCAPRVIPRSPGELAAHREEFIREVNEGRAAISRSVVQRVVDEQEQALAAHAPPPTFDILILSGGGDKGAFGAGVLEGWGSIKQGEFQRPQFDVVTGVSTGALIAPYAFVGTDEAYKKAYFAYKKPKKEWFRLRNLLSILTLRGDSFVDNTGLSNDIKAAMDDSLLRAISEGRRQNRVLLIGTTNLDLGMMTMWNATRLADEAVSGERTRETFDNVILASTAIPAVFPPVRIEGDLYVDGGVTRNIAYTTDQDFDQSAVNIWMREQPTRPLPRTRVWVIINNQLCAPPAQLEVGWPGVVGRSLDLFIQYSTVNCLKSLAVSLAYLKLRTGLDIEMHYLAIPNEWRPPVKGTFKKETMNALAELGRKLGADPAAWKTSVPNPESPEP